MEQKGTTSCAGGAEKGEIPSGRAKGSLEVPSSENPTGAIIFL